MNNHGCLLLLLQEGSACPSPSHEPLTLLKAPFPLHRLTAALLSRSYGSVSSPGPTTWEGPPCPPFAPAQAPAPPGGPTAPASPLPLPPPFARQCSPGSHASDALTGSTSVLRWHLLNEGSPPPGTSAPTAYPAHPPSQAAPLSHVLFMLPVSPTGRKAPWQGLYLLYPLTSPKRLEWAWHWWVPINWN